MTLENLGRQDLSEIAEARMFARYSELGMGQRAIAEKLGVDQATVSRRLSLLLLAPEVQAAIAEDAIRSAEGAALAGALPYGPARSWQKKPDPAQGTDVRRSEQLAAFTLIAERGMSPTRAAERVLTERKSREQASAAGLDVVDPRERFGESFHEHRLFEVSDVDLTSANVVGAIDPGQGTLVYYAVDKPSRENDDADELAARREAEARSAAAEARREAGKKLAASVPSREKLVTFLIDQYAFGVSALATSQEGWRLAQAFVRLEGLDPAEFRVSAENGDEKRRSEIAWACAVAGYELAAADPPGSGAVLISCIWTCCPSVPVTSRPRGRKPASTLRAAHCLSPIDVGDARCITLPRRRVMHRASPGSGHQLIQDIQTARSSRGYLRSSNPVRQCRQNDDGHVDRHVARPGRIPRPCSRHGQSGKRKHLARIPGSLR